MLNRFTTYEQPVDIGLGDCTFGEVVFTEDFGPWKKGDRIDVIQFEGRWLTEWTRAGAFVKKCKVKLAPDED